MDVTALSVIGKVESVTRTLRSCIFAYDSVHTEFSGFGYRLSQCQCTTLTEWYSVQMQKYVFHLQLKLLAYDHGCELDHTF